MASYEGNNYSSAISFRVLFLLTAIIFFIFGLIFRQIPSLFYVGVVMIVLWIIGNLIVIILGLDK